MLVNVVMSTLKKLNYLMDKRIKIRLVAITILIILGSFAELLGVAIILPIVNLAMDTDYKNNMWCKIVINITGISDKEQIMIIVIGIAIFIYIAKSLYLSWMYGQLYKTSAYIKEKTAVKLMQAYMKQPYAFFLSRTTPELIRSVNSDTAQLYEIVLNVLQLSSNGLTAVCLLVTLAVTNLIMTGVVAGLLGICALFIMLFIKKRSRYYGRRNQELSSDLYKSLQQMFEGIKEIKIINSEDYFINEYSSEYRESTDIGRKYGLSNVIPKYLIELMCMSGILVYLAFEIVINPNYMHIIPQLAVFVAAAYKLLPSVNAIYAYLNTIIYHRASIDLVYHDIKEANELTIKENDTKGEVEPLAYNECIELHDVSFRYDNQEKNVLNHVNIMIPKGKSVAFVGPSGGGKTTLADIVIGLLRPTEGQVTVDNEDILNNIEQWRKQIGYIPQSIYLIDDTLKTNVAWGMDSSKIVDEKVWEALKKAQLADFVTKHEKGLNMDVGERGTRISGGQRQRIGIARALYRDPEVLVFDEATSALDNETEKEVMEAINSLQGTKTMIMIAHRLSTVENCDIIFKVENGCVKEISKEDLYR